MGLTDRAKYRNTLGTLILSNDQLMFTRSDGFISKTERIVSSIPFTAIANVNVEAGLFTKKLVILVDRNKIPGIPRHEFEVANPYNWMNAIRDAITSQLTSQQPQPQQTREVYVKEITREIVKIPCKYCGCLNTITDKKCSSCGAPIN